MPLALTLEESAGFDLHDEEEWLEGLLVAIQDEEGQYGPQLKWIIELDDDEPAENGEPRETWAYCSQKFTPRSKLYGWVKAIDPGAIPEPGGVLDLEEFIGRRIQVMFERYMGVHKDTGDTIEKEKVVKLRAAKTDEKKRPTNTRTRKTEDANPGEEPF